MYNLWGKKKRGGVGGGGGGGGGQGGGESKKQKPLNFALVKAPKMLQNQFFG